MRSFAFEELGTEEFDEFSATHPQGNFQQTSLMGEVRTRRGIEVRYLGVREDGKLVAAAELEIHKSRLSTFAEVHNGPLCDFHDAELTRFLFENLARVADEAGCAQIEITPDKPWAVRTSDGEELEEGAERPAGVPDGAPAGVDQASFDNIVACGFVHAGFDRQYNAVPRWRYLKDLTPFEDDAKLLSSYNKNTKRNVKIARNSSVHVERASREDLPTFHALCEKSCEKQGFENRPLEYFELLYDCLGDNAVFYIAYFDARAFLKSWEDKRDGFARDLEHLEELEREKGPLSPKNQKKLNDVRPKYEASLKRIESAHAYLEEGEKIPAAAALFCFHPRECVYLFSGSDPKFAKFYAATAIQHRIMSDCIERGCGRYNFYGIDGIFDDPDDPGRGLLEFKQGFAGYVEEMMGSFTLPVKPGVYKLKQVAHKILGR